MTFSYLVVSLGRRGALGLGAALAGLVLGGTGKAQAASGAVSSGRWVCTNNDCDPFIYDPNVGDPDNLASPGHPIPPGVRFEDLPETWKCPLCGSPKSWFRPTTR
ncbi:rubredoxin [Pararhodospirillum oryzae]|uniref:Rubredoxin-like domain-containing protein n=1 Tax=Pararhodospirillum oryzae TaxID=478448 RepID=A0A512H660_9PROT|nr:rubredoxin [Pararhodospirillum oryzae]GEO80914.1 hypothetical protein ROR02_10450 [Pararhodospirillum oryzae]